MSTTTSETQKSTPTVATVIEVMRGHYPENTAAEWDKVGLIVGATEAPVQRIMLAVDASQAVIDEAVAHKIDLLITHHPLLLRPVTHLSDDTPKGLAVSQLIKHGISLYAAHTNADIARHGVNEALASVLGLHNTSPIIPEVSDPHIGLGRVGSLPEPLSLGEFAARVAAALPATHAGVRVSGPLDAPIERVAVCGGAGDSIFEHVRASQADVYLTSDLRHHPAIDAREHNSTGRPYLIDVAHFASEWPWLPVLRELLMQQPHIATCDITVSKLVSDAWSHHIAQTPVNSAYSFARSI